jgi:hypothetical protein
MPVVTATFERRTFRVQAIRVTKENMREISEWCGGDLARTLDENQREYISVTVGHVNGRPRLARAYAGNWVTRLTEGNNFRVYKDKSFTEAFSPILSDAQKRSCVLQLVKAAMREQDVATYQGESKSTGNTAEVITDRILELF